MPVTKMQILPLLDSYTIVFVSYSRCLNFLILHAASITSELHSDIISGA